MSRIIKMLVDSGYITGVQVYQSMECDYPRVSVIRPEITLKGMEYLSENQIMKRMANTAKEIIVVIKP